jgi:tetratricopeptide (TPR) repeat protein
MKNRRPIIAIRYFLIVIVVIALFAGCQLGTRVHGEYYLNQEKYNEGIEKFREKLKNNKFDPAANYYLGRYLLALDRPGAALPYLKEAVALDFSNADYHFWLGVCFHGLNNLKSERASYQRAIKYDGRHVMANLYLGHSYLEHNHLNKALDAYERVLEIDRYHPQALYNRGLVLNKLKRYPDEIAAWQEYLKYYPEGRWAVWAVDHLNAHGNFDYRNHTIGDQKVPLIKIRFEGSTAALSEESKPWLEVIGSILSNSKRIDLVVVCYKAGNKGLANERASNIRRYLVSTFPMIEPDRLKVSGINKAEKIKTGSKTYRLDDSVKFVTIKN